MLRNIFIVIAVLVVGFCVYTVVRPSLHSPGDRKKIIMFGQSSMGLWFKHLNWPYPLRIRTTYKPWPIPYHKFSRENLYLEYHPIANPKSKDPAVAFGEKTLRSVSDGLDRDRYDAAFFKYCFVDFPVKDEEGREKRFDELCSTVVNVHELVAQREMKLILGNALPLPDPNELTLRLQRDFNSWLSQYAAEHDDVMVYDLFGPLTDEEGRFRMELAHAKDDHHPGEQAFQLLDQTYFSQVEDWMSE